MTDLSKLTSQQLDDLAKEATALSSKRREDEKKALRDELVEKIKKSGFNIDDIFPGSASIKTKTVSAVKYRDPSNAENTWTGRGRKPGWLNEAESAGRSLDDFAV
tara:strand:- start:16147 stop:16461 length:315 start_codon:yes stop_codon:yes gene_type:complete